VRVAADYAKPANPKSQCLTVTNNYGVGLLGATGPLLVASWGLPDALAKFMKGKGLPLPERFWGALLVDTRGDFNLYVRQGGEASPVANNPNPERLRRRRGSSEFSSPRRPPNTGRRSRRNTRVCWGGSRKLRRFATLIHGPGVRLGGRPIEVIGLLGRDILSHCRVSYDGPKGSVSIEFDLASLQAGPSRI
jgi:hypothetical protein